MPAPLKEIPSLYLNNVEEFNKSSAEESMQAPAEVLHEEAYHTPSAVTGCIDIAVNFDIATWNFGFAISALTKKVLDQCFSTFSAHLNRSYFSSAPFS